MCFIGALMYLLVLIISLTFPLSVIKQNELFDI